MERELAKDGRDDELRPDVEMFAAENAEAGPIEPGSTALQDDAAESIADALPEMAAEATPAFPADEPPDSALPSDASSAAAVVGDSEALADLSSINEGAPADGTPQINAAPAKTGGTDWSNFVPAPGYADPKTGKPRFLTGRVNQAGLDLSDFVYGLRPVFEPEVTEQGEGTAPQAPWFARSQSEGSPPPPFQQQQRSPATATAPVFVNVSVSLTPGELQRISKDAMRKGAEFSRGETMIVARKLLDLTNEVKMRESQRRIAARDY
jgi:hypothetical protein